mmetsp:Transcript_5762/g.9186  ORF Transcript_5762/g.9186 Transcript_5762/m.9186 type:complete len:92 (+) Transcript_5762:2-277(+)
MDKLKEYIFPNRNQPVAFRLASWGVAVALAGGYWYYEQQKLAGGRGDFSQAEHEEWNKKIKSKTNKTPPSVSVTDQAPKTYASGKGQVEPS